MLTPPQDKLHWSKYRNRNGDVGWGGVVIANNWKDPIDPLALLERGRRSDWHKNTIAFAETLVRQKHTKGTEGRAWFASFPSVKSGDLRHAAYWLAIGKPKSHTQFDNDDLDRVLNVFRLLVDPEDLAALLVWNDYQQGGKPGERKRHIWWIKQAPLAYVNAILDAEQSFYGDRDFERFPLEKLRCLTRTLKNRHAEFHRPVPNNVSRAVTSAATHLVEGPF